MFLRFKKKHEKQWYLPGPLETFSPYVWTVWNMFCEVCLLQVSSSALDHEDTTIHCGRKKDLCWQELKQCNKPTP